MIATLGIDLGSTTCKAVLLGKEGKVLGRGITNTRADYRVSADIASREAILDADLALLGSLGRLSTETLTQTERCLRLASTENTVSSKALDETAATDLPPAVRPLIPKLAAIRPRISGRIGTGYGRALLPFPETEIRSEILCHGKGARYLFPDARTVLDIGGQDTKAIQLDENGLVASFFMNDRCAAGCGRYLGYVAEELGIGLTDLGPLACAACRAVPVTSTCTVFAGTEVRSLLYAGEKQEEVLLGLHRAVVLRALSLLARSGGIFDALVFTGGVAQNQAVVRTLKEYLAKDHPDLTLHIHPDAVYTGALGAALYALETL
ncbi:BadF/BadG/BcrA/BcrD ATPase family protein [Desulfobacter sp.]|uniref:BadF/BadG/BcrA/BcrD ATPase family protein n=1 Tax=Desulfobacter sp. TaxID=2294 RepID=UPI003D119C69